MPIVEYAGRRCERGPDESVLDALLRADIAVPHACRAGVCNSCLLRGHADVPPAAQRGLKEAWKAEGYFLACACYPDGDFVAGPVAADARTSATISGIDWLSPSVLHVRLQPQGPFEFRGGQYVTLFREDGLARSYSLACLPSDDHLALHVRMLPDGRMGRWLAEATPGTRLELQGPAGECFYVPGRPDQPLLLAGTGTGLAPLVAIVRDALRAEHRAPIHLFHGAVTAAGLYFEDRLRELAAHPLVTCTPTTLDADGPIDQVILRHYPKMAGWRAFLCGDPAIVQGLKKRLFLAGAALGDIHADAFLPSVTMTSGAA